jgi:hypothetical protein
MEIPMIDELQTDIRQAIPRWHKWLFWINIGLVSTFLAEVVSGSDMFPYFHPWGIMVVVPLYMLHCLVLVTWVFRWGRPTLPALYFAGTLFGLYEAYITKVLWNPPWDGIGAFKVADVALFETLVLVFFWHVWMSFILPLLAVETWLTNSNIIIGYFPARLRRFFSSPTGWLVTAALGGLFVSINAKSPGDALLSGLGALTVLGLFGWTWRRLVRGKGYTLEGLLPDRGEFRFLVFLLAALYLLSGFFLRPEAYPSALGHFTILTLYAAMTLLLVLALRRSKSSAAQMTEGNLPQWFWIAGVLTFTLFAVLAKSLLLPLNQLFGVIGWFAFAILGVTVFLWLAWGLLKRYN